MKTQNPPKQIKRVRKRKEELENLLQKEKTLNDDILESNSNLRASLDWGQNIGEEKRCFRIYTA